MFTTSLCAPAIIYIGFSLIQILIDIYKGIFNSAFIKFIVMIVLSLVINILCNMGLTVIAWFLVFIPIIMMTIISTLLLRVFGTDPNETELQSKVKDASNNLPITNRIDRDEIRDNLYDKIGNYYDLSNNEEDKYDLSNNATKYFLVDSLVNDFGNNYFINSIRNSKLFNFMFGSSITTSNSNIRLGTRPNIDYGSGPSYLKPEYEIREDHMEGSDFESYGKKYDETYFMDGYLIYKQSEYNKVKNAFNDPNVSDMSINKAIEANWNQLTEADKQVYDDQATETESAYDPYDFRGYRSKAIPLQSSSVKYADPCAPGKERNSTGLCVRPCKAGFERLIGNGECKEIKSV